MPLRGGGGGGGYLKCHLVMISAKPILWDKVICRNSAFPFQTLIFPGFTQ